MNKIRNICIIHGYKYELGDTIRIKQKEGHYRDYPITEIREFSMVDSDGVLFHGYQLWSDKIQLAWIPYHAVQAHFYEVREL